MLSSKNLNDKTYEEFIAEAIAQIPLYSDEWTNYNPSDPGITILENLSAFAALQRSSINEVPESVKWKLLKLAGFTPQMGQAAEILLGRKNNRKWEQPRINGQKIYAQNLCFEFANQQGMVNANLVGIRSKIKGEVKEWDELLSEYGAAKGMEVFSAHPSGGEELYFYFDELPQGETEISLYVEVEQEFQRNPVSFLEQNPFAAAQWWIYTEKGKQQLEVVDQTGNFLTSGIITLSWKNIDGNIVEEPESERYMVCMQLIRCAYDLVPKVRWIRGMLSKVIQKDTKSAVCHYQTTGKELLFSHELLEQGRIEVYQKCENHYKLMNEQTCRIRKVSGKSVAIFFLQPMEKQEGIIVISGEDMLGYKKLGKLIGYDNQELELPPWQRTYEKEFSLLAAVGEKYYLFAPNDQSEDALYYTVDEQQCKIIVRDAGAFEGAELFLGNYCIYSGDEGNVIPGTAFSNAYACAVVKEGRYKEEFEETRRRFVQDLNTPATAVTRQDYETLVRAIPGLSIHKIRADVFQGENRVQIVIKPNSKEEFPRLSDTYCRMVKDYLSKRRMLSTGITIMQPQYVPIHVKAVIHVKKYAPYAKERIEEAFIEALDGIHSDKNFGETIHIHDIFEVVAALDCVEEILEMNLLPGNEGGSVRKGLDIQLKSNALGYPGELNLELNTV